MDGGYDNILVFYQPNPSNINQWLAHFKRENIFSISISFLEEKNESLLICYHDNTWNVLFHYRILVMDQKQIFVRMRPCCHYLQ